MKFVFFILCNFLTVFASIIAKPIQMKKVSTSAKHETYRITNETANKLCKRHNLEYVTFGCGMVDGIDNLSLQFNIVGPLPKDKLRNIIIDCMDEYYNAINQSKSLKQYLVKHPLPRASMHIVLGVRSPNREKFIKHPDIALVVFARDQISYFTKEKRIGHKAMTEESLEEAKKIITSKVN